MDVRICDDLVDDSTESDCCCFAAGASMQTIRNLRINGIRYYTYMATIASVCRSSQSILCCGIFLSLSRSAS